MADPTTKTPSQPGAADSEAALRDSLKRCSPETVEAAIAFRKAKNSALVPVIVMGIIERYLDPDMRPRLKEGNDDLRVIEDLGVDSLTMMEVVFLVEETLEVSINNDELRNLRTLGDIKVFIECKVDGVTPPETNRFYSIEKIAALMPQQPPFLFLSEASLNPVGARGKYSIKGDEFFLEGHFQGNPVFPASIMLEALGQLGVLFLLDGGSPDLQKPVDATKILFTSCEGIRCHRICRPGDVLELSLKPKRIKHPVAVFEGSIQVGRERTAVAEELTLTFDYRDDEPSAHHDGDEASKVRRSS